MGQDTEDEFVAGHVVRICGMAGGGRPLGAYLEGYILVPAPFYLSPSVSLARFVFWLS